MDDDVSGQVKIVTLIFDGLSEAWRTRFARLAVLIENGEDHQATIAESKRLLVLAMDNRAIAGILHYCLAQTNFRIYEATLERKYLDQALDDGLRAQKVIERRVDKFLWALCEFNLGVTHEALAMEGEEVNHLMLLERATDNFERAAEEFEGKLLAEIHYRIGSIRRNRALRAPKPDTFSMAREDYKTAAKLFAAEGFERREIDALYMSALVGYNAADILKDNDAGVECLKEILALAERKDTTTSEHLDAKSLLGRTMCLCAVPQRDLEVMDIGAMQIAEVVRARNFEQNPWAWLAERLHLVGAYVQLATWTLEWKEDSSDLAETLDSVWLVADMTMEKCDSRFPEFRRDFLGKKFAILGLRLVIEAEENKKKVAAQIAELHTELKSMEISHPSTRGRSIADHVLSLERQLRAKHWPKVLKRSSEIINEFELRSIFLQSPEAAMYEIKKLASIGHMAAYAEIIQGNVEQALALSEASKSRFLYLTMLLDSLSGNLDEGAEFRAARDNWLTIDNQMRRIDRQLSDASGKGVLQELVRRKKEISTAFGAASSRISRLLSGLPLHSVPHVNRSTLEGRISGGGVVVSIIVTNAGGAGILILGKKTELESVLFPKLTTNAIHELFEPGGGQSGWLEKYRNFRDTATNSAGTITLEELDSWSDEIISTGEKLWELFLGPLHDRLKSIGLKGGAEVTLVLPGVLGALPICAASQFVDRRRRFFLEDWAVSSAPSVHSLGLAKVANPKNANVQSKRLLVAGELSSIQSYRKFNLDAISLQNTEHSKLIQALRDERFRIWAFGCHGIWDSDSPGNSRLIVSTDEVLTVSDIQNEQLAHCRLALLGACETGILDVSGGLAEQIGFPASLVEAGVEGVVGSLWLIGGPVDEFLARVLNRHLQGSSPAAALRSEQLALVDEWRDEKSSSQKFASRAPGKSRFSAPVDVTDLDEIHVQKYPAFWAAFNFTGK